MIHYDLTFDEYRALPGWNWSLIKLIERSPKHARHARLIPDNDTASRAMLRAVHCLALEGREAFDAQFVVYRDGKRDPRTKLYQAFLECNPGKTVLTPSDLAGVEATAAAILGYEPARAILASGKPEVTVTWTDETTGLPCKGRIDWLGEVLGDLKTLGTTDEREVARLAAKNGYHGQLAHYDAGLRANGIEVPACLIVAEGKGAHDVAVFEVDDGFPDGALHVGRKLRDGLMARLAECVATDRWPGRHESIQSLCLPTWALDDEEITIDGEGADLPQEDAA